MRRDFLLIYILSYCSKLDFLGFWDLRSDSICAQGSAPTRLAVHSEPASPQPSVPSTQKNRRMWANCLHKTGGRLLLSGAGRRCHLSARAAMPFKKQRRSGNRKGRNYHVKAIVIPSGEPAGLRKYHCLFPQIASVFRGIAARVRQVGTFPGAAIVLSGPRDLPRRCSRAGLDRPAGLVRTGNAPISQPQRATSSLLLENDICSRFDSRHERWS